MVMTRRKLPVDMAIQWFVCQTGGHETDYGKQECVMFHQVAFNTKFFCFGQLIWIHKIKLMLKLANFLFDFLFEKSCRRQQQLAHLQKLPSCCCEAAAAFNCSCFQMQLLLTAAAFNCCLPTLRSFPSRPCRICSADCCIAIIWQL